MPSPTPRFRGAAALLAALGLAAAVAGCAAEPPGQEQRPARIRIGFSLDTLKEERWQRDRDQFVERARELGADVIVQAAAGDDYLQRSQAENMLSRGVDVLVVVPHNAQAMAPIVAEAQRRKVPVIAYDRLIANAPVDLYISFDNEKVGELQAQYLTRLAPTGNYVYIGGAPTDFNARLLREGAMKVLLPLQASGAISLVQDVMTPDWLPDLAERSAAQALAQHHGRIAAVVAANDGTAGGVVHALAGRGMAGRVPVSGQDADLAALRRIVAGTQSMTIFKPIHVLARMGAEIAVALARGERPQATGVINNGTADVPAILIEPVTVDRENLRETVVKAGFQREEDIFGRR